MPLQNRITPFGQLEAVSARGAWLGNRGILHDDSQRIVVPWRRKAWVTCTLDFPGRQRAIFSPGNYSELFFLDEATALCAGHRPCAECRRHRYQEFKTAWCAANPEIGITNPPIGKIDEQLHRERAIEGGQKAVYTEVFHRVPHGAFVDLEGIAHLVWSGKIYPWTHHGYGRAQVAPTPTTQVSVLTPASLVATFRQGFLPEVHPSAQI